MTHVHYTSFFNLVVWPMELRRGGDGHTHLLVCVCVCKISPSVSVCVWTESNHNLFVSYLNIFRQAASTLIRISLLLNPINRNKRT